MNGRKKVIVLCLAVTAACVAIGLFFVINHREDYSSFITMGCTAERFEQRPDVGYLTLSLDAVSPERELTVAVDSPELWDRLSNKELSEVIGVSLALNLPGRVVQEDQIDAKRANPFELLVDPRYDQYVTVQEIYWRDP